MFVRHLTQFRTERISSRASVKSFWTPHSQSSSSSTKVINECASTERPYIFFKKTASPAVFELCFFRGTEGECWGEDWGQRYYIIFLFFLPPFLKREEPRAQSLKRRGKRNLAFPSWRRGERVSFYEGIAIL